MPDDLARYVPRLFGDQVPPMIIMPAVPRDRLLRLVGQEEAVQQLEKVAVSAFVGANPEKEEWKGRLWAAQARKDAAESEAARIATMVDRTEIVHSVASRENSVTEPWLRRFGKALGFGAAFVTVTSAVNVAANYVIESAAWSNLVEQPLLAVIFVVLVPAGGVGGLLGIASSLPDDESKVQFRKRLAAATLCSLGLWIACMAALYALQVLNGDMLGRRTSDTIAVADASIRAGLLVTQLLTEVGAGALLKLMSWHAADRAKKQIIVENALHRDLKARHETTLGVASEAGSEVGALTDFERNFQQALEGFLVDCRAEFRSLSDELQTATAKARSDCLRSLHAGQAAEISTRIGTPP